MGSHQVPQKYLQGFGIPPDRTQIWMYDKHDRAWRCLPIKRVAQQPGYFDADTERELSERVENPAHTVLDLLRAGELPLPTQREVLALYIAVMIKRVPRRRRQGLEIVPEAVSETIEEIRVELDALYQATGLEIWRKRLAELDAVHEKYKREPPDIVLEQIRS